MLILAWLLCGLSVGPPTATGVAQHIRPGDVNDSDGKAESDAIGSLLNNQVTAWNRGDLESFMQGYLRSHELTFFSGGNRLRGWRETLARYRRRYQGKGREMGQLEFVDLDIQLLAPRSALVRGGWELETSKGPLGGLFSLILRKTKDGWKIIHDHTSSGNESKKELDGRQSASGARPWVRPLIAAH